MVSGITYYINMETSMAENETQQQGLQENRVFQPPALA